LLHRSFSDFDISWEREETTANERRKISLKFHGKILKRERNLKESLYTW
jgi:hypothetical protein